MGFNGTQVPRYPTPLSLPATEVLHEITARNEGCSLGTGMVHRGGTLSFKAKKKQYRLSQEIASKDYTRWSASLETRKNLLTDGFLIHCNERQKRGLFIAGLWLPHRLHLWTKEGGKKKRERLFACNGKAVILNVGTHLVYVASSAPQVHYFVGHTQKHCQCSFLAAYSMFICLVLNKDSWPSIHSLWS